MRSATRRTRQLITLLTTGALAALVMVTATGARASASTFGMSAMERAGSRPAVRIWGPGFGPARPAVPAGNKPAAYAGYIGSFSPVTKSTMTLAMPVVGITCTSPDDDNPETYYIGLYSGNVVSYVSVEEGCAGTTPLYLAGIVTDTTDQDPNTLFMSGGDKLHISVAISATTELLKIVDKTSKQSLSYGGTGFSPTDAEILCYGVGQGDFPPFAKVKFSRITLNKAAFSASKPTAYNQVDPSGNTQLSTSHLTTTGKGFTIKYISNQ